MVNKSFLKKSHRDFNKVKYYSPPSSTCDFDNLGCVDGQPLDIDLVEVTSSPSLTSGDITPSKWVPQDAQTPPEHKVPLPSPVDAKDGAQLDDYISPVLMKDPDDTAKEAINESDAKSTGPTCFKVEVLSLTIPKSWNDYSGSSTPTSSNDVAETEVVSPCSDKGMGSETESMEFFGGSPCEPNAHDPSAADSDVLNALISETISVAEAKPPALRRLKAFCFN